MLYFLVAFIAFSAFKQWNAMFGLQAAIQCSDDSCPSSYPYHQVCYTHTMFDTFPSLDMTLDDDSLGFIWHLYYATAAGHKTHNPGCMTHML